jgi:hypothetical protein
MSNLTFCLTDGTNISPYGKIKIGERGTEYTTLCTPAGVGESLMDFLELIDDVLQGHQDEINPSECQWYWLDPYLEKTGIAVYKTGYVCYYYKDSLSDSGSKDVAAVKRAVTAWKQAVHLGFIDPNELCCEPEKSRRARLSKFYKLFGVKIC